MLTAESPPTSWTASRVGAVFVVAWVLLLADFASDALGVVDPDAHTRFQRDSESLVMGRIVQTRAEGWLSEGGLTGRRGRVDAPGPGNQHLLYATDRVGRGYEPYRSHPGANGWLFSAVDRLLPSTPGGHLVLMNRLQAGITATVFAGAVAAVARRFGLVVGASLLVGTLLSQWVVLFAHNLWWCLWAFYLPLFGSAACVLWVPRLRVVVALGGLAFALKVGLTGFEYVTAVLIAGCVPWVYAAIQSDWRPALRGGAAYGAGMIGAGAAGLAFLVAQNAAQSGSWAVGAQHILSVLGKRSHGDPSAYEPVFREGLSAGVGETLWPYVATHGPFALGGAPWFAYGTWCVVVALVVGAALWRRGSEDRVLVAMSAATAASLAAPLSWFILFKGHSFVHQHMNAIVWHMPFVPMTLICLGVAVQSLVTGSWRRREV